MRHYKCIPCSFWWLRLPHWNLGVFNKEQLQGKHCRRAGLRQLWFRVLAVGTCGFEPTTLRILLASVLLCRFVTLLPFHCALYMHFSQLVHVPPSLLFCIHLCSAICPLSPRNSYRFQFLSVSQVLLFVQFARWHSQSYMDKSIWVER